MGASGLLCFVFCRFYLERMDFIGSIGFKIPLPIRRGNIFDPPAPETGRPPVFPKFPLPPSQPAVGGDRGGDLCSNPAGVTADAVELRFDRPRCAVHCCPVKGGRKLPGRLVAGFDEF